MQNPEMMQQQIMQSPMMMDQMMNNPDMMRNMMVSLCCCDFFLCLVYFVFVIRDQPSTHFSLVFSIFRPAILSHKSDI